MQLTPAGSPVKMILRVNGTDHHIAVVPGTTLLDAVREVIGLTGTKKSCDRGACGACTVHVDGARINACSTLAVMQEGREVTTVEGLGGTAAEHPVQRAFIEHDGLQCGFCTPGQIMSAAACIAEGHAGSDEEIREWMSGNLCRCGAYVQIVEAVRAARNHLADRGAVCGSGGTGPDGERGEAREGDAHA